MERRASSKWDLGEALRLGAYLLFFGALTWVGFKLVLAMIALLP